MRRVNRVPLRDLRPGARFEFGGAKYTRRGVLGSLVSARLDAFVEGGLPKSLSLEERIKVFHVSTPVEELFSTGASR